MDKNSIVRPTRCGELAQHSEAVRSSRGGKCGGRAEKQRVLTWGGPAGATGQGVSRGHSTEQRAGGRLRPIYTKRPEDSMSGRAEPNGNVPTVRRTPRPMTPVGQALVSAAAPGSMGAFRSRP
mgnify:CR=1 FL=1